jgi:hypothetical protein
LARADVPAGLKHGKETSIGVLMVVVLAIIPFLMGCGPGATGREKEKIITRWKSETAQIIGGSVFGLVIEKDGNKVNGRLFELKGRNGFEILETYPPGRYDPIRRELILPLGQIAGGSLDDYLKAGMPFLKLEVILSRNRLVAQYHLPGLEPSPYAFVRYEPPVASAR